MTKKTKANQLPEASTEYKTSLACDCAQNRGYIKMVRKVRKNEQVFTVHVAE